MEERKQRRKKYHVVMSPGVMEEIDSFARSVGLSRSMFVERCMVYVIRSGLVNEIFADEKKFLGGQEE